MINMNLKATIMIALCVLICSGVALCQKYEQESRIKEEQLPSAIPGYLDKYYPERSKVKHYEEYSKTGKDGVLRHYYESKFDSGHYRYSVKFDSSGALYDIERLIDMQQLPSQLKLQIEEDLSQYFQKHRTRKLQEVIDQAGTVIAYELVVKGSRERDVGYYELRYDPEGQRISVVPIQETLNPFFFF
jgi:hypothetical protein